MHQRWVWNWKDSFKRNSADVTCWRSCTRKNSSVYKQWIEAWLRRNEVGGGGLEKAFRQRWCRCKERMGTTKAAFIIGPARVLANCFWHGVVLATGIGEDAGHFVATHTAMAWISWLLSAPSPSPKHIHLSAWRQQSPCWSYYAAS